MRKSHGGSEVGLGNWFVRQDGGALVNDRGCGAGSSTWCIRMILTGTRDKFAKIHGFTNSDVMKAKFVDVTCWSSVMQCEL